MRSRGESEGSNERTMELPLNYLIYGKQKQVFCGSPGYPSEVGKIYITQALSRSRLRRDWWRPSLAWDGISTRVVEKSNPTY